MLLLWYRNEATDKSGCGQTDERTIWINMEEKQFSKTYDRIPTPDIAISMGCDVGCPYIGRAFDDNWSLPDPTGQGDEVFKEVIKQIEERIMLL